MTRRPITPLLRLLTQALPPDEVARDRSKQELLETLVARGDWRAPFEAGLGVRQLRDNPVVAALAQAPDPTTLLRRWQRLERYGHTHHRTELCDPTQAGSWVAVRHLSLDGPPPTRSEDVFIWGILLGLLELSAIDVDEALVGGEDGRRTSLLQPDAVPSSAAVMEVRFRPSAPSRASSAEPLVDGPSEHGRLASRVAGLVRSDLLRTWTLKDAGRALGMSSRSLQRHLRVEGTRFALLVQTTRLDVAVEHLRAGAVDLGPLGFLAGFSDQAHFSRTCRRHHGVPPSALRDLLHPDPR